jgi:DnaJ domain
MKHCPYGMECRNREICLLRHPDQIRCRFGAQCTKIESCPYRHEDLPVCRVATAVAATTDDSSSNIIVKPGSDEAAVKRNTNKRSRPRKQKKTATLPPPTSPTDQQEERGQQEPAPHDLPPRPNNKPSTKESTKKEPIGDETTTTLPFDKKKRRGKRSARAKALLLPAAGVRHNKNEPELEVAAAVRLDQQDPFLLPPPPADRAGPHIITPTTSVEEEQVEENHTNRPVVIVEEEEDAAAVHQKQPNVATNKNNDPNKKPTTQKPRKPRKNKMKQGEQQQQPRHDVTAPDHNDDRSAVAAAVPPAAGPEPEDQVPPPNQAELMDQLRSMGFTNEIVVLKALQETKYRLDKTITALLIAREADIVRIMEATTTPHAQASAAFEYSNGDILAAIHHVRRQLKETMQFASTEELGQAVFVTAAQRQKLKRNQLQRQKAVRKKRQRRIQRLLLREETAKRKKQQLEKESIELPESKIVSSNTDDSNDWETDGEEIEIIFEADAVSNPEYAADDHSSIIPVLLPEEHYVEVAATSKQQQQQSCKDHVSLQEEHGVVATTEDSKTGAIDGEAIDGVSFKVTTTPKQKNQQRHVEDHSSMTESDDNIAARPTVNSAHTSLPATQEMDERKAAKKERQRLRRLAEKDVDHQEPVVITDSATVPPQPDTIVTDESVDEEEKKRRWREKLKRQKQQAAEKRAQQKTRRYEEFRLMEEQKTAALVAYWGDFIQRQDKAVDAMVQLCCAEFCSIHGSNNSSYTRTKLLLNETVQTKLFTTCRGLLNTIEIPTKVKVEGLQQFAGRTGTVEYWDGEKQRFLVSLLSKTNKDPQPTYIAAEYLDANVVQQQPDGPKKSSRRSSPDHSVDIAIESLIDGIDFSMILYRSELKMILLEATSFEITLNSIVLARREEERMESEREEVFRQEEEKDKARREQRKKHEQEDREAREREYQERKHKYDAYRAGEARRNQQYQNRERHANGCRCAECLLRRLLFAVMADRYGYGGFSEGQDYNYFDDDDDDDASGNDDGGFYDRQWNDMNRRKEAEKNQIAADLLGVDVDASADEIKRVYRRKALRYHPDKYRAEEHDVTEEEAADHFKELNNAYDRLLSNFD